MRGKGRTGGDENDTAQTCSPLVEALVDDSYLMAVKYSYLGMPSVVLR
jgi:hypothetical protein